MHGFVFLDFFLVFKSPAHEQSGLRTWIVLFLLIYAPPFLFFCFYFCFLCAGLVKSRTSHPHDILWFFCLTPTSPPLAIPTSNGNLPLATRTLIIIAFSSSHSTHGFVAQYNNCIHRTYAPCQSWVFSLPPPFFLGLYYLDFPGWVKCD